MRGRGGAFADEGRDEGLARLVRAAASDVAAARAEDDAGLARRLAAAAAGGATAFPDAALVIMAGEVLVMAGLVAAAARDAGALTMAGLAGSSAPAVLARLALTVNLAAAPVAGGIIIWLRRRGAHAGADW